MDSDGVVVDKDREPDTSDVEVLTWYKNMLTGTQPFELLWNKSTDAKGVFPGIQSA